MIILPVGENAIYPMHFLPHLSARIAYFNGCEVCKSAQNLHSENTDSMNVEYRPR